MTHTRQYADDEGTFSERGTADCPHCQGKGTVIVRLWESSDGAYEDVQYRCTRCWKVWWVDGIDS